MMYNLYNYLNKVHIAIITISTKTIDEVLNIIIF